MIEQNSSNVKTVTWEGRRFQVVPMDSDPRYMRNLFTLEMDDGSGTMVIVDTNDRRQEFGAMYAYLAPERTFLWAVGDVDPPDGKVVGAVVNIIYPA